MNELYFGYNTNGFAHHTLEDALQVLAELGYDTVAITLDHGSLHPGNARTPKQLQRILTLLERFRHPPAIETGARFVLDPWRKHQPTLISPSRSEREIRRDYLKGAIDIARRLDTRVVSFWSGSQVDDALPRTVLRRLVSGCRELCDYAEARDIRLAFEPEPGMFIDRMDRFSELLRLVNSPVFGLTIDIGHLHCQGEPIVKSIQTWRHVLWNVHIEDMRCGVHEHLMFGEGEIDFAPVLATLRKIGYAGGVNVELSRHSHNAVEAARRALAFLRRR